MTIEKIYINYDNKVDATIGGFKQFANTWGGSMATGFVMGGIGAGITGGDIWQGAAVGCVVALANFSLHKAFQGSSDSSADDDGGKKKIQNLTNKNIRGKEPTKIEKLHKMFDVMEEVGGGIEMAGVVAVPFTGGASFAAGGIVGGGMSLTGTLGNIVLDATEYINGDKNGLSSIGTRVIKLGITFGMGKAIDRIPGGEMALDKIILKTKAFIYDKLVTPKIEAKYQWKQ